MTKTSWLRTIKQCGALRRFIAVTVFCASALGFPRLGLSHTGDQRPLAPAIRFNCENLIHYTGAALFRNPYQRLGATYLPEHQGTRFRVWSPHAEAVSVIGSFSRGRQIEYELMRESEELFAGDIPGALPGHSYTYRLKTPQGYLERADPVAQAVRWPQFPQGKPLSLIVDHHRYQWKHPNRVPINPATAVIYELHVGYFYHSDGKSYGTFAEARKKLRELKRLGVTVVALMPWHVSCNRENKWGYNPLFPWAVHFEFGHMDELKALIDEAHGLGLSVWVDFVSHVLGTWSNSPLYQFDGSHPQQAGAYVFPHALGFTEFGLRLDIGRPLVQRYLLDLARYWIEFFHVDSIRMDCTSNIRMALNHRGELQHFEQGYRFLQHFTETIRSEYPDVFLIAEDAKNHAVLTQPTTVGGAGLDAQFDITAYAQLRDQSVLRPEDSLRNMHSVAFAISHIRFNEAGRADLNRIYQRINQTMGDHDQTSGRLRLPNQINAHDPHSYWAQKLSTLSASVMLLGARGIPMLFMGEEFLAHGRWDAGLLPWDLRRQHAGIWELYRDMIALRRNLRGQTKGLCSYQLPHIYRIDETYKLLAMHLWDRGGPGDDVIVVYNFSGNRLPHYRLAFPREGKWVLRLNSDLRKYSSIFTQNPTAPEVSASRQSLDGLHYAATLDIGPYSTLVYSQEP